MVIAVILIIMAITIWQVQSFVTHLAKEEGTKITLWAAAIQKKAKVVTVTRDLLDKLQQEERKKATLYALAIQELNSNLNSLPFIVKVMEDNTTVPIILADQYNNVLASKNIEPQVLSNKTQMYQELVNMKKCYKPIHIKMFKGMQTFLYYKDSKILNDIKLTFDNLVKTFISEVASNSAVVPVIFTNSKQDSIIASGHIQQNTINSKQKLQKILYDMKRQNQPILVDFEGGKKNYIFYEETPMLSKLRYYPFVLLSIVTLFLGLFFIIFKTYKQVEHDRLWVGMSKETAHQLGTPLTSLIGWIDYLKDNPINNELINDISQDVKRLELVSDRFSKIGSLPKLQQENICEVLKSNLEYLQKRTTKNIEFNFTIPQYQVYVKTSITLFNWVMENLTKNAIDAMEGVGKLTIHLTTTAKTCIIDVTDTGKGIIKSKHKAIFDAGYTTKTRGWGLGLSLCKRIIENFHSGKIFVLESNLNDGTTFRIIIPIV